MFCAVGGIFDIENIIGEKFFPRFWGWIMKIHIIIIASAFRAKLSNRLL
jgi:hypothetical protein